MLPKNYFKKNGYIYGVSYHNTPLDDPFVRYFRKFINYDDAEKWLNQEEYDFRTRELISESRAKEYGMRNYTLVDEDYKRW